MKMRFLVAVLFFLTTLTPSWAGLAQAGGASLSASNGSGEPGDTGISIPVRLSPDQGIEVTGVNFDLNFDSSQLSVQNVAIGGAASSAGKTLSWSQPSSGRVRLIIFGLNQTPIQNGTIAIVSFNINPGAAPGSTSLSFSNATATDANGNSVATSTNSGTFTVTSPPPPPATATNTAIPPSPTQTPTSQPKTLPSATPSFTHTPQFSPTRTPTDMPVSTSMPTNTMAPTNTSVPQATSTRAITPTATISSRASTLSPTTPTALASETAEALVFGTPTSTILSAAASDQVVMDPPVGSGDQGIDPNNQLEVAVAATGTALANFNDTQASEEELILSAGDGNDRQGRSGDFDLAAFLLDTPLISTLFLGTGVVSALMIPVVALYVFRKRSVLIKQMRRSESAIYQERLKDQNRHSLH